MGVHLVFFLHIDRARQHPNVLALAIGVLIVILLMGGSLWIAWMRGQASGVRRSAGQQLLNDFRPPEIEAKPAQPQQ
jgi:hypothetical protein